MHSIFRLHNFQFHRLVEKKLTFLITVNKLIHISCRNEHNVRQFRTSLSSPPEEKLKYSVVFLGSDNFSVPSLMTLIQLLHPENLSVVVSNYNNIIGKFAKKQCIRVIHWDQYKMKEFVQDKKDFGVVTSFGHLIPARVIDRFPMGILNVHASLLPRWRGAAPIAHSIISGDAKTGVSIMKIAPHKFDVGPVLLQKEIPIHPHIRRPELTTILSHLGAEALATVISDLEHFLANPISQDESEAKLSPKLTQEMSEINWGSISALNAYNLFRGLYGAHKLKTTFQGRRVDLDEVSLVSTVAGNSSTTIIPNVSPRDKIPLSSLVDFSHYYSVPSVVNSEPTKSSFHLKSSMPGQIVCENDIIYVKCNEHESICQNHNNNEVSSSLESNYLPWIAIRKVKVGNKWMNAKDFRNGFLSKVKPEHHVFTTDHDSSSSTISVVSNRIKIKIPAKSEA